MFSSKLLKTVCFLAGFSAMAAYATEINWLITPEEAAKASSEESQFKSPASAFEGMGPLILVKNPKALGRIKSPVDIFVSFSPGKSGLPPDMETLNVTLVGFFNIDITDRLQKYVKKSSLDVVNADLPTGSHRLRMAIKDIKGNLNERDVVVRVIEE